MSAVVAVEQSRTGIELRLDDRSYVTASVDGTVTVDGPDAGRFVHRGHRLDASGNVHQPDGAVLTPTGGMAGSAPVVGFWAIEQLIAGRRRRAVTVRTWVVHCADRTLWSAVAGSDGPHLVQWRLAARDVVAVSAGRNVVWALTDGAELHAFDAHRDVLPAIPLRRRAWWSRRRVVVDITTISAHTSWPTRRSGALGFEAVVLDESGTAWVVAALGDYRAPGEPRRVARRVSQVAGSGYAGAAVVIGGEARLVPGGPTPVWEEGLWVGDRTVVGVGSTSSSSVWSTDESGWWVTGAFANASATEPVLLPDPATDSFAVVWSLACNAAAGAALADLVDAANRLSSAPL